MIVKKQFCNFILICCMLAIAVFWFGSEFHETMRTFRSFQASYSEITRPCPCQKRPVLFVDEELTDTISSALGNSVCRVKHASEFLRHYFFQLFACLVFAAMLLRRCMGAVYQFSNSPTCELARILGFLQSADGRKKFLNYSKERIPA